jgi:hypothetical protein
MSVQLFGLSPLDGGELVDREGTAYGFIHFVVAAQSDTAARNYAAAKDDAFLIEWQNPDAVICVAMAHLAGPMPHDGFVACHAEPKAGATD